MKLLIFGPQGSGKGTQAKMIAKKYGLNHISPGAIMRHEIEEKSELGKEIEPLIDAGKLVPTEKIMKIVKNAMSKNPNFIFDGFPRELHQAKEFDKITEIDKAILLEVPDEISVNRIAGRRTCDEGHEYHIEFMPPKKEGFCDKDGLPLHKRDDDEEDAIKQRLKIYHEKTEPVIRHYDSKGKILRIDGNKAIEKVFEEIENKLKN